MLVKFFENAFDLENVTITNVENKDGVKKGDSYLSEVNNFTVSASGKHKSDGKVVDVSLPIITKCLPKSVGWLKTFRSADFFNNECIFYNTVWKAMNQFQLEKNVKVFESIPLCISAYSDGTNDYIALENVNYKGFSQLTRSGGLDFDHAQLIMRLFARFHALGLAFKDQKPEEFQTIANALHETYFSENYRNWYSKFQINNLFPLIRDAIKQQLPESYLRRFDEVTEDDFFGKQIKSCERKGRLAVITHGDAWAPNFLLKYEGGNLMDAIMIDFQLARYASLGLDITFFLYSCTEQPMRLKYWDRLIEGYHETFVSTLKQLGSNSQLLTLEDLKEEIKLSALFGVGMSMEALAMSLLADDDVADLKAIEGEEVPLENVWVLPLLKDVQKQQRVANMLKHAIDSNFF
ncbi:uncharacterized protein LOC116169328 isoform X2 [Photinus pyralis]|nr:uncharacterized protein LOC116169328 isoform X2 [Photinus pyralis]XP_031341260.1 uncharacterized protein LOC116169328 isoform X2 [Photinus pyralis]